MHTPKAVFCTGCNTNISQYGCPLHRSALHLLTALGLFLESVPPSPEFTDAHGVKVYGLQLDELDINLARAATAAAKETG